MKRVYQRPKPAAQTPSRPEPIRLAVTATEREIAYWITNPLIAHRYSRSASPPTMPCKHKLMAGLTTALQNITERRVRHLLKIETEYREWVAAKAQEAEVLMQSNVQPPAPEPTPEVLTIEVRTDSPELIAACASQAEPTELHRQLDRFQVNFVMLPPDAEELAALRRWASINCRPGLAAMREPESRADYRAAASTYEALDWADQPDVDDAGIDEPDATEDDGIAA